MMLSRREWLRITAGAGAAMVLKGCTPSESGAPVSRAAVASPAGAASTGSLLTRAVPSTGEQLPVIGLGGANTFSATAGEEDFATIGQVLSALVEGGGTVFDTAAGYGASEEVSGRVAQELGIADRMFWATKVNVVGRGGASADPAAVRAQLERSFERLRIPRIDLIQVHNMGDPPTQLGILQELKAEGRIRYTGITTTSETQYGALAGVMREYPIDFIGIDYAVDNRVAEETILPLAQDRGVGVLVYLPFGRSRMWQRIGDRPLPEWASEFDADTWAQFMLKFVIAHPAVTVATPGTSRPEHMFDNLAGGIGRLPTEAHLRRMIELVESLPAA
ncbi:MAG TPA: aldo/keto reductase [Longimicrobiaceae bacterium]|nr:aldo/keto reductase [Longimicrobiaceae bacterium]